MSKSRYIIEKEIGLMYKKEGKNMAVLAKTINRISVIKRQESQEFVREFTQNKVTDVFGVKRGAYEL